MLSVSRFLEAIHEEQGGPASNQNMDLHPNQGQGATSKQSTHASALPSTTDRTEAGSNKGPAVKESLRFHSVRGVPYDHGGTNASELDSIPSDTMRGQAPPES